MTPQLMQAIKLLQLSNLDLIAYVDAELERNPLLERADGEAPRTGRTRSERRDATRRTAPPKRPTFGDGGGRRATGWKRASIPTPMRSRSQARYRPRQRLSRTMPARRRARPRRGCRRKPGRRRRRASRCQLRGLQSRGLRRRGEVARRSPRRPARARRAGSGDAARRADAGQRDRRDRLSPHRPRRGRRAARRAARSWSRTRWP